MAEVRLTWPVDFHVEYWYEGLEPSGFEDDDVCVEIAAVEEPAAQAAVPTDLGRAIATGRAGWID